MTKNNVILISIDAMRYDVFYEIYNYFEGRLKKYGFIHFNRCFSNGPGTNQSFPSIFTSTPFLLHGSIELKRFVGTLAESLSNRGYYTIGFHSNPFLSHFFGYNRGFREYYDFIEEIESPAAIAVRAPTFKRRLFKLMSKILKGSSKKIWSMINWFYYYFGEFRLPYVEAAKLNVRVISRMERYDLDKPLFLWVHYMDVHNPFAPPEEFLEDFSSRKKALLFNYKVDPDNPKDSQVKVLLKLYKGETKYTLTKIVELLHFLEERGFLEDSIIVITADHGEAFMEHGKLGHAYDILYNEVLHVPLLIGGIESSVKNVDSNVQLLDLAPTLLDILNVKPPRSFEGTSFRSLVYGEDNGMYDPLIFSESAVPDLINLRYDTSRYIVSVLYRNWKLIFDKISCDKGCLELYDLSKDFDERNNLVSVENDVADKLYGLIKRHLRRINAKKAMYERLFRIRSNIKLK